VQKRPFGSSAIGSEKIAGEIRTVPVFSFQPQSVAVAKTNLRGGVEILARLHFGEKGERQNVTDIKPGGRE
jgi:hypothetical protein